MIGMEFHANIVMSPFGRTLDQYAATKLANRVPVPAMIRYIAPLDLSKINITSTAPGNDKCFYIDTTLATYVVDSWFQAVEKTSMDPFFNRMIQLHLKDGMDVKDPGNRVKIIEALDQLWLDVDTFYLGVSKYLDRPDEPGRFARELGLFDPDDPSRPTFVLGLKELADAYVASRAAKTPAPAASTKEYVPAFPVASTLDTAAQSAHSYLSETQTVKPKEKTKTKGSAAPTVDESTHSSDVQESLDDFPDALPSKFKLPKKILKVKQHRF